MCVYVCISIILLKFFFSSSNDETQYELEDRAQSGSHAGNYHGRIPIVLVAVFSLVRIQFYTYNCHYHHRIPIYLGKNRINALRKIKSH
jgi:hypothetical protein